MANIKKLIENADNAYYAAEYDKAIRLYKQILDLEPSNKHARQQLKKSEINRPSKDSRPQDLPKEALQNYKRSRSFITAGDLAEAKRLLKNAIQIAEDAGVDFGDAQNLLKGIQSAVKAVEYKKKALDELEAQQWGKAEADLNEACNLDPTDEVTKTLLEHLKSLIKAHKLISNLNVDDSKPVGRSSKFEDIRKIIDMTSQTTALSKLWQEVVSLLRQYTHNSFYSRVAMMTALATSLILIVMLWALYLVPRKHVVVDCTSVFPGLIATATYPVYIANGDEDVVSVSFTNNNASILDGNTVFVFDGSVKVKLVSPTKTNKIEFKGLSSKEKQAVKIHFSVDAPFRLFSNDGDYIEFNLCTGLGYENKYRIAISPIYGLRTVILFLWGSVGVWFFNLFGDSIKTRLATIFNPAKEPVSGN